MYSILMELNKDLNSDLAQLRLHKNKFFLSLTYLKDKIFDLKTMENIDDMLIDIGNSDKTEIVFPIKNHQEYLGYLLVTGKINKKETKIIYILLKYWGRLVFQSIMEKKLNACSLGVMQSAINAIEVKDIYTRGHSMRVARYSELIAIMMNLPSHEINQIVNAALLHDVGKMGVSSEILNKEGPLDEAEKAEIFKHPNIGVKILKPIPVLETIIYSVLHHHERYDGKGYPMGLKGKDIPLHARIIAVADSFDAMTSNRSYRRAIPLAKTLEEIKNNAGTQFDPQIVRKFLEIDIEIIQATISNDFEFEVS